MTRAELVRHALSVALNKSPGTLPGASDWGVVRYARNRLG